MRKALGVLLTIAAVACSPAQRPTPQPNAMDVAGAKDTAFIRANCVMPDSVLAGTRTCVSRVQAAPVHLY